MTIKTNKSFLKRLKVSKNGKIRARNPGQNHFNAKESSGTKNSKHRGKAIQMKNKAKSRFLVNF